MLNEIYHACSPIAFSVGPFAVRWYGIAYLLGFILAAFVIYRTAKRWKIPLTIEEVQMVITGIAAGVIVGGRLFYVVFYAASYYLHHPLHILFLNEGGMSFHGGLVGAIVGGALVCKYLKISTPTMIDLGVCGAPLGLFLGRIANFINGELWGKPTNLPWAVAFESGGGIMRHPSQLYEALLEGLLLFVLLYILARKSRPLPQGSYLGVFMMGYGIARFLIEFVRVPDVQLGYLIGFLTMGQLLSIPLIVGGIVVVWWAHKNGRAQINYVEATHKA